MHFNNSPPPPLPTLATTTTSTQFLRQHGISLLLSRNRHLHGPDVSDGARHDHHRHNDVEDRKHPRRLLFDGQVTVPNRLYYNNKYRYRYISTHNEYNMVNQRSTIFRWQW